MDCPFNFRVRQQCRSPDIKTAMMKIKGSANARIAEEVRVQQLFIDFRNAADYPRCSVLPRKCGRSSAKYMSRITHRVLHMHGESAALVAPTFLTELEDRNELRFVSRFEAPRAFTAALGLGSLELSDNTKPRPFHSTRVVRSGFLPICSDTTTWGLEINKLCSICQFRRRKQPKSSINNDFQKQGFVRAQRQGPTLLPDTCTGDASL